MDVGGWCALFFENTSDLDSGRRPKLKSEEFLHSPYPFLRY